MNFLIILNIFTSLWGSFNKIDRINKLKAEGEKAYLEKNYTQAINKYNLLIYNFNNSNERVRMNLAHAYYKNNDTISAAFHYKKLTSSSDPYISSVSNQQLGLISALQKQNKKALSYFKEALKADPGNESARFNYELTIKKIKEEKNKNHSQASPEKKEEDKNQNGSKTSDNDSKNKAENKKKDDPEGTLEGKTQSSSLDSGDQQNGQKNNSDKNSGSDGEEYLNNEELELNEKGSKQREALISRRLKKINMTREKARNILEAMKNAEIQYLQQIRKTGKGEYGKDKPDW
jgi:Ca-activated chloride channel homolog